MTPMSGPQVAYAAALALRDMEREQIAKQIPPQGTMTDEQYAETIEQVYAEANYYEHLRTFHDIEQKLLAWAHKQIRTLPQYASHQADMERVFTSHYPTIRSQLIDTCMRLRP